MIVFEGIAVGVGLLLILSHLIECIPAQRGVLLGIAAGLGFGILDVAIKALSGDLGSGPVGLLSPWSVAIVTAAVFSFYASARSLQIGDGVAVIAVTSVAANPSTILAGLAVLGDRLGDDAVAVGVRLAAFALILVGAALIPAPVRAGEALESQPRSPGAPPRVRPERVLHCARLLQLPRRPQQRGQDHRGQPDHQPDDPAGDVLAHEHRAQDHGDADDPACRDQAHRAALQLRAAPLSAGHHTLWPLAPPGLALALANLARSELGLGLRRRTLGRCGTPAGL
jgi:hypothetical protein